MRYTNFIGEPTIEKVRVSNNVSVTREYYACLHPDEYVDWDVIGVLSSMLLGQYAGYASARIPCIGTWYGYPVD